MNLTGALRNTEKNRTFCESVRDDINKDYPHIASAVVDEKNQLYVLIADSYWDYCCRYVQKNCKVVK